MRKKVNKYVLYQEENRYKGCVAAEFEAVAENEEEVRKLADKAGYSIDGYTIEEIRSNVTDTLGYPYLPYIRKEF